MGPRWKRQRRLVTTSCTRSGSLRRGISPAATGEAAGFCAIDAADGAEAATGSPAELAALLASLWVEVEAAIPYAAGELLSRIRERGTVELDYRERDVLVRGRMAPALAGEVSAAAARWSDAPEARA